MRNIQVSTDVFQAIWAARRPREETEDSILRRLLRVGPDERSAAENMKGMEGFRDARFGVVFPEGFEAFRTYMGQEYRAQVRDGHWHVNGRRIDARTINELSAAIGTKTENGWVNWNYRTPSGEILKISALRDPTKVRRRGR
jgi:hypothetical protein